ncbi:microtubule associated protein-domain-containing protein, partial [Filobasidium floriforme]|uniref:microtubule associated protein-domain-containing protein n=1 Tax=Filobasidium floriforme TaxID=5210 RepID=UPI001E8D0575
MNLNSYLEAQIPYLRTLHSSLGLASSELANDLRGIEEAIKQAIDARVEIRKDAVKELEEKIAKVKKRVGKMREVLGEQGEKRDQEGGDADMSLPARLGSLESEEARLKSTHEDRMLKVKALTGQISSISAILGKTYSLPPELTAKAGLIETHRDSPAVMLLGAVVDVSVHEEDLMEDGSMARIAALEEALRLVHLEKIKRAEELNDLFDDLRFLHGELCLPTDATRSGWYIPDSAEVDTHLPLIEASIASSENDVNPTETLTDVCLALQEAWVGEKTRREAKIQSLYDELEPIWLRLQVTQEEIQTFIEAHCGLAVSTIEAYKVELQRVKVLRSASLGGFVQTVREEIQGLWDRLLYGPRSTERFRAFYAESISEEILAEHEKEAQRLTDEVLVKGALLSKAQEWVDLKAKEEELEAKRNGPDRFNTRGGALLQEEKMRKRLGILKPKLEAELMREVPLWEEEHNMDFLVDDIRIVEIILLEQEAKDAEKEAKKRTKIMGNSAATPARLNMSTQRTPLARSTHETTTPTPFQRGHRATRSVNPLASSTSSISNAGRRQQAPPPVYGLPRPTTTRNYTLPPAIKPLGSSGAHNVAQPRVATYGSLS